MTEIEILAQKAIQNIEKEQINVAKVWLSSHCWALSPS